MPPPHVSPHVRLAHFSRAGEVAGASLGKVSWDATRENFGKQLKLNVAAWNNAKAEPLQQLDGAAGLIADTAASRAVFGKSNPLQLNGGDESQGAWAVMTMMPGGFELCYKCNAPVSSEHFERQV